MFYKHLFIAVLSVLLPLGVAAYTIEQTGAPPSGDFIIEPAKLEIVASPGDSVDHILSVTNRAGESRAYTISVEDIQGGSGGVSVELLGGADGPYPLRHFVVPQIDTFTLEQGERLTLPIRISVPKHASPGGRYGVVLFSGTETATAIPEGGVRTKLVSRLGALLFVRIAGDAHEDGRLEHFARDESGFEIVFRNSGNVHLNPSGTISVRNLLGSEIAAIEVEPYYSLPDSVRYREIAWSTGLFPGRYTATLTLQRGYGDSHDEASVSFWILPQVWPMMLTLTLIAFVAFIIRWIFRNVEIRKRER